MLQLRVDFLNMPYPALPPAPPAAIAAPSSACEESTCPTALAPSADAALPTARIDRERPDPIPTPDTSAWEPEFSAPALPAEPPPAALLPADLPPAEITTADLAPQTGTARAALLGTPSAAGYVQELDDRPPPRTAVAAPLPAIASPRDRPLTPAAPPPRDLQPGLTEQASPAAPAPPDRGVQAAPAYPAARFPTDFSPAPEDRETAADQPPPRVPQPTYTLDGVSGKLATPRQASALRTFDRAWELERLAADFRRVEAFIRARSAVLSQSPASQTALAQTASLSLKPFAAADLRSRSIPVLPVPPADFSPIEAFIRARRATLSQTTLPPASSPFPADPTLPDGTPVLTIPTTPPFPQPSPPPGTAPAPTPPTSSPPSNPAQPLPPGILGVIELTADRQDYDEQRKIFTAEGKVVMRFQGAVLDADRLQVNLNNRIALAEGNVALRRGEQVLRGNRFEYNFVQGTGTVLAARGEVFIPAAEADLNIGLANDLTRGSVIGRPASDQITTNQPLQVVRGPGGFNLTLGNRGGTSGQSGLVNRLRFVAERLDFNADGWVATNLQITNDPFSPPELILKTERATFTRLSPLRDEIRAERPRLVFDQRLTIPIFFSRIILDRRPRQPPLAQLGFDRKDRGGLFVERTFNIVTSPAVQFSLTPQIFLQRIFTEGEGVFSPSNYGLKGNLNATLGPRTTLVGAAVLTSLSPDEFDEKARASLRLNQRIGTHRLTLEASYRDRLYNGSLGFQTVQSTFGAIFTSPVIALGTSGINLTYQGAIQNISARSDRDELLSAGESSDIVNLTRYQAAVALSKTFVLWQGKALPATATEGLRYTPFPIQPYISLSVGTTGVLTGYSNGDSQNLLSGEVRLNAQFGHFSRPFLDYTAFNLGYSQRIRSGESPFFFDRSADRSVLSFGFSQQIYGPFRFGIQGSYGLDRDKRISFDYILEYSRRTYGIVLRYNPELRLGSLNLRISDFNWTGGAEPFPGTDVVPVERGIVRTTE